VAVAVVVLQFEKYLLPEDTNLMGLHERNLQKDTRIVQIPEKKGQEPKMKKVMNVKKMEVQRIEAEMMKVMKVKNQKKRVSIGNLCFDHGRVFCCNNRLFTGNRSE